MQDLVCPLNQCSNSSLLVNYSLRNVFFFAMKKYISQLFPRQLLVNMNLFSVWRAITQRQSVTSPQKFALLKDNSLPFLSYHYLWHNLLSNSNSSVEVIDQRKHHTLSTGLPSFGVVQRLHNNKNGFHAIKKVLCEVNNFHAFFKQFLLTERHLLNQNKLLLIYGLLCKTTGTLTGITLMQLRQTIIDKQHFNRRISHSYPRESLRLKPL